MLSKKLLAEVSTVSLACLLSLPAMAQASRGLVRGLVTDQSGSVLPEVGLTPSIDTKMANGTSSFAEVLTVKSTNLNRKDLTRENSANV
jgi:hypothetical protein